MSAARFALCYGVCRILSRRVGNLRLFAPAQGVQVALRQGSIDQGQSAVFDQDRLAVGEGLFGLGVAAEARQRRALRAFGERGAPVIGGQRRRIDRLGVAREFERLGDIFFGRLGGWRERSDSRRRPDAAR